VLLDPELAAAGGGEVGVGETAGLKLPPAPPTIEELDHGLVVDVDDVCTDEVEERVDDGDDEEVDEDEDEDDDDEVLFRNVLEEDDMPDDVELNPTVDENTSELTITPSVVVRAGAAVVTGSELVAAA